jgi:hypothetical protein
MAPYFGATCPYYKSYKSCRNCALCYDENNNIKNIVTCQPIVGLRKKALLGSRPLSTSRPSTRCAAVGEAVSSPCRAVPSRTAPCAATQQAAMTSHGSTLVSEATPCKHSDLTQQR